MIDSMMPRRQKSSRAPSRAHSDQGKPPADEVGGSDPIKVVGWICPYKTDFVKSRNINYL